METDKEEKKGTLYNMYPTKSNIHVMLFTGLFVCFLAPKCGFLKENENLQKILNIVLPEIRTLREGCALVRITLVSSTCDSQVSLRRGQQLVTGIFFVVDYHLDQSSDSNN